MANEYIIIKDGVVSGHFCGPLPSGATVIPNGFGGRVGDNISMFDENWNYLPIAELVAKKLVAIPVGYKVQNNDFVEMTLKEKLDSGVIQVPADCIYDPVINEGNGGVRKMRDPELVKAGIIARPKGQVLDQDGAGNPILRSASPNEQVTLGDMTQATADTINAVNMRAERDALLAGCDWVDTVSAQTRIPAAQMSEWTTYRQALRDVSKQGGFPSGVIQWPIVPNGVTP